MSSEQFPRRSLAPRFMSTGDGKAKPFRRVLRQSRNFRPDIRSFCPLPLPTARLPDCPLFLPSTSEDIRERQNLREAHDCLQLLQLVAGDDHLIAGHQID